MTEWYLGTMGYGYKDWLGVFYPPGLASNKHLAYYSRRFNAVEMDTTYYGTPRRDTVVRWRQQTPPGFKFCPKTPQKITHELKLLHAEELMAEFVETMQALQDRLGAILIQLPPDFGLEGWEILGNFLKNLLPGFDYAVEFRNRSWDRDETRRLLGDHSISWVSTEYIIMPHRLHCTADFVYVRWLGRHGQFEFKNRVQKDVQPSLRNWREQILSLGEKPRTFYGFFNNDFSGHSPATCNQFKRMMDLPVAQRSHPRQRRLFD